MKAEVLAVLVLLAAGCTEQTPDSGAAGKLVLQRFPGSKVDDAFAATFNGKTVDCVLVDGGMVVVAEGKALMRDELDGGPFQGAYEACAEQPKAKARDEA